MPRTPRNGFASAGCGRKGSGLSAPTSSVRRISGRPPDPRDYAVRRDLLVLVRQRVPSEEHELRPQEPDALRPVRRPRRRPRASRRSRTPRPATPSRVTAGTCAARRARAARRPRPAPALGRFGHCPGVRLYPDRARRRRAAPFPRAPRGSPPEADDRREAERAGQDRAVRRRASVGGRDSEHEARVESRGLRRASGRRRRTIPGPVERRAPRRAGQVGDDLAADGEHVGGPLALVLVLERRGSRPRPPRRPVPGVGGVPAVVEDRPACGLEQRLVLEVEQMRVEDLGAVLARACRDRGPGRADASRTRGERASCSRPHSARGSAAGCVGDVEPGAGRRWRGGPTAMPGAPGGRRAGREQAAAVSLASSRRRREAAPSRRRRSCPRPGRRALRAPPRPARRRARTSSSWPWRAPSVAIA